MNIDAIPEKNNATNTTPGKASDQRPKLEDLGPADIDRMYQPTEMAKLSALAQITDPIKAEHFFVHAKVVVWRLLDDLQEANHPKIGAQRAELQKAIDIFKAANEMAQKMCRENKRRIGFEAALEDEVNSGRANSPSEAFIFDEYFVDITGEVKRIEKGRQVGVDWSDPWFQTPLGRRRTNGSYFLDAVTSQNEAFERRARAALRHMPEAKRGRPPEVEVRNAISRLHELCIKYSGIDPIQLGAEGKCRFSRQFAELTEFLFRRILRFTTWGERSFETALEDIASTFEERLLNNE